MSAWCRQKLAGPFADLVHRELSEYTLTAVQPGEPIRGRYHWEPAHEFSVRLNPRGHLRALN